MAIRCPYCQHAMEVRGAKPGRYTPGCPQCHRRFAVLIPDEPDGLPMVGELRQSGAPPAHREPPAAGSDHDDEPIDPRIAAILGIDAPNASPDGVGLSPRTKARTASVTAAPASVTASPVGVTAAPVNVTATPVSVTAAPAASPALSATAAPGSAPVQERVESPPQTGAAPARGVDVAHQTLGGYELLQRLGQGGMGAVYLARQMSLDRNVAVKVLHPRWAGDAQFVARFTREAYAAAQLVHHNVVQIHDIGAQERTHFYSMEFVPGQTLADVIRQQGRLEADVAVSYVLQAARGLKFAHERGMIHRDIKPENLLLNDQGLVKVADLGLVKTAMSQETAMAGRPTHDPEGAEEDDSPHRTRQKVAMGTPLYMPPEQAEDAAHVDARADIYSLGCTLYALLTGAPPFTGQTAREVMHKHATEAPVPPGRLAKRVPDELSAIVLKMIAKRPADRYRDISDLIAALEGFLGVDGAGPVSAREDQIHVLEDCVETFEEAPLARLRRRVIGGFAGLLAVAIVGAGLLGHSVLAAGLFGFGVMTAGAYFILSGMMERTVLFARARQWAWHSSWRDWVKCGVGTVLLGALLVVLGWGWAWLGFAVAAVGTGAALYFGVDRPLARQRAGSLERARMLLRQMRGRGMEENAIRHFVCKFAAERWEAFYEALFGYEAKMEARGRWGLDERGRARPRFRAWRDGLIAWVEAQEAQRREAQSRRHLQMVEARGLEAAGVDALHARQKAKRRAEAMVAHAAAVRRSAVGGAGETAAAPGMLDFDKLFDAQGEPAAVSRRHEAYLTRRYGGPLDWLIGERTRFAAAMVLLTCFVLWLYQNKGIVEQGFTSLWHASRVEPPANGKEVIAKAVEIRNYGGGVSRSARALWLPMVPDSLAERLGSFHAALAGLILLVMSFVHGRVLAVLAWVAAGVALVGHEFTAGAGPMGAEALAMGVAVGLALVGLIFFRTAGE